MQGVLWEVSGSRGDLLGWSAVMGKVVDFVKRNRGTFGSIAGFLSGLAASKYPAIAGVLDSVAKALGGQ